MILLALVALVLPSSEYVMYQTCDHGRLDTMEATLSKDSLGYHVFYVSDRTIEIVIDSLTLQTHYVKKVINGITNVEVINDSFYRVFYKGREHRYSNEGLVYDRHTLDFAFRGFPLSADFRTRIRLAIPEFRIINADLEVVAAETLRTPAGVFPCWKLKMSPRIIFIKRDIYFWYEQASPHRFIKLADASGNNEMVLVQYRSPAGPPEP